MLHQGAQLKFEKGTIRVVTCAASLAGGRWNQPTTFLIPSSYENDSGGQDR